MKYTKIWANGTKKVDDDDDDKVIPWIAFEQVERSKMKAGKIWNSYVGDFKIENPTVPWWNFVRRYYRTRANIRRSWIQTIHKAKIHST